LGENHKKAYRFPDFLQRSTGREQRFATFFEESRMQFGSSNNIYRKSGFGLHQLRNCPNRATAISRILLYSMSMPLKTITFRLPEEKLQALDTVAKGQQRDRSFVINEAVTQYLSLHEYHRELIEEGIRQADAGEVIEHQALMSKAAGWARKPRAR
jgi:predicted transcriptional regulator